ncbi:MAG: SDR family oxidoreductase [Salinisphaera sp.]|uniref:SDR family oxidoreductase n=1 Tax=Salinisphaera sp. TaxID=1914330 RepID=UPI003C7B1A88
MGGFTFERELQFSDALVNSFAELTGDCSSLHTDEAFARRTRFRQRPAHGMLAVMALAALARLEAGPASVRLESIQGHFREPIWTRDRLLLRVQVESDGDARRFNASWTHAVRGTELAVASGRYWPVARGRDQSSGVAAPAEPPRFEELDPDLETLEGRSETIGFTVDPGLLERFESELLVAMGLECGSVLSPELLAVMMLSPMSGMRLPGRRGASLRFALDFTAAIECGQYCTLTGTVRRVQLGVGLVSTDLVLQVAGSPVATGSAEAVLTGIPTAMPSPAEIASTSVDMGIKGRIALVVGGSRGVGEVTAKFLALLGASVALTYHRGAADAEHIIEAIRAAGGTASCFACDVRSAEQVATMVAAVSDEFGGIDMVVNCFVGRFDPSPAMANHWDGYLEELEISVKGVHNVCSAVVPVMQARGAGKIVNFSATAVHNPMSGQSRHATAKGAVEAYTRNLAKELIRSNIQVNLVIPNMIETDLLASVPRTFRDRLAAARDYGRHVQPTEAAQAVAFLVSQWSNAMTGQALVINLGEPPFG